MRTGIWKWSKLLTLLALLPGLSLARAGEEDSLVPGGIAGEYEKLSNAIQSEDLPVFMKIYHMDFIYEAMDGSCLDRGPWRRLWMENFETRKYERASFEIVRRIKQDGNRVVLRTRRIFIQGEQKSSTRRLQEAEFDDTWEKAEGAWKFLYQKERKNLLEGTLKSDRTGTMEEVAAIPSPRLAALARDLNGGRQASLSRFWKEVQGKAPLVETIPGDAPHRLVSFLWRSREGERIVRLEGGLPATCLKPLERLGDTNLWYRTERLPGDARLTYEYYLENQVRVPPSGKKPAENFTVISRSPDPLNPGILDGKAVLELPGAPPLAWAAAVEDRPSGDVERFTIRSSILEERRFVSVYTPPDFDSIESPCKSVYLMDRGNYSSRRSTAVVMDNLLAEKKFPPLVVFMIHSEGSRGRELEVSEDFTRFLGEELIPWAREEFGVSKKPSDCIVGGNGPGGALAALAALKYPDIFGSVLSESGSFPEPLARKFVEAPRKSLAFHLSVGCLESPPLIAGNQHLRDVLEAKGYPVTFVRFSGNHNSATWNDGLAGGIQALLNR